MYYYPDELYHHGIKGQRWGVRNGPPYPLNPQTHASVVRSAGHGSSGKKKGKIGKIIEYNKETGLFSTPTTRFSQRHGLMDEKGMTTKKFRRLATGYGAAAGALQGAATSYLASQGLSNKTRGISTAVGAGAGALAGGLGANVGARLGNKIRKGVAKANKKYLNPRIKGIDDDAEKKARRKKIARNIAIGAGAAGLGYLAYRGYKNLNKLPAGYFALPKKTPNGNLALPGVAKGFTGNGWSKLGKARMRNGKRVSSVVAPGKKFKFTSRSTGTSIVPANTNRQLGFLNEEPRRLNWKRVAAAASGAAALGGGTATGISAYRKKRKKKR